VLLPQCLRVRHAVDGDRALSSNLSKPQDGIYIPAAGRVSPGQP
jgi:hypothetical protein